MSKDNPPPVLRKLRDYAGDCALTTDEMRSEVERLQLTVRRLDGDISLMKRGTDKLRMALSHKSQDLEDHEEKMFDIEAALDFRQDEVDAREEVLKAREQALDILFATAEKKAKDAKKPFGDKANALEAQIVELKRLMTHGDAARAEKLEALVRDRKAKLNEEARKTRADIAQVQESLGSLKAATGCGDGGAGISALERAVKSSKKKLRHLGIKVKSKHERWKSHRSASHELRRQIGRINGDMEVDLSGSDDDMKMESDSDDSDGEASCTSEPEEDVDEEAIDNAEASNDEHKAPESEAKEDNDNGDKAEVKSEQPDEQGDKNDGKPGESEEKADGEVEETAAGENGDAKNASNEESEADKKVDDKADEKAAEKIDETSDTKVDNADAEVSGEAVEKVDDSAGEKADEKADDGDADKKVDEKAEGKADSNTDGGKDGDAKAADNTS